MIDVPGVKGLWLELAIVADLTMLKFHGRERVEHYVLALMNIVSTLYKYTINYLVIWVLPDDNFFYVILYRSVLSLTIRP